MAPHSYKLVYFDARGRAEVVRTLFALGDIKYEDVRYTREEWEAHKKDAPFGQLPVLYIDGKPYAQSAAITTYVAKEVGVYGKNNIECLRIDQITNLGSDWIQAASKLFYEKDEAKKAELLKQVKEEHSPKYLSFFEKLLKENGSNGFCVGTSLTLADIYVSDLVSSFGQHKMLCTEGYPLVEKLLKMVAEHEKLKKYFATRKQTDH